MAEVAELTPEQRCERIRMALMEAGHPADAIEVAERNPNLVSVSNEVDDLTLWRAMACAGVAERCWPCWSRDMANGDLDFDHAPVCPHDPLTSPWPPLPTEDPRPPYPGEPSSHDEP